MEAERFGKEDPKRLEPALSLTLTLTLTLTLPLLLTPSPSPSPNPNPHPHPNPNSRARSKYVEPEGGRFVPPLKPACSRDKGPDPYGTAKHARCGLGLGLGCECGLGFGCGRGLAFPCSSAGHAMGRLAYELG